MVVMTDELIRQSLEENPIEGIHIMIGAFVDTFFTHLGILTVQKYRLSY